MLANSFPTATLFVLAEFADGDPKRDRRKLCLSTNLRIFRRWCLARFDMLLALWSVGVAGENPFLELIALEPSDDVILDLPQAAVCSPIPVSPSCLKLTRRTKDGSGPSRAPACLNRCRLTIC